MDTPGYVFMFGGCKHMPYKAYSKKSLKNFDMAIAKQGCLLYTT